MGLILAGAYRLLRADGAGWLQFATVGATAWAGLRGWGPYVLLGLSAAAYSALAWAGLA